MNATIKTAIGPTILLGSGSYFDYLDPENSDITIEDYAAGLAFECRFSGQCVDQRTKKRVYYSVAQHAVIGSHLVPPEYAFDFLMHESGEPVCGDMVSPLKTLLPEYRGIEKRCEAAIMAKFGVTMSNPELIKEYDLRMWATERQQLMEWDGQPWGGDGFGDPNGGILPLDITIIPVGPEAAYEMFLARYRELHPDDAGCAFPLPPSPADHVEPEPDAIEQSYRAGFIDGAKECADNLEHAQETVRGLQRILEELSEKQISKAVIDVIRERRRQMAVEGWSIEHDDQHLQSELAWAAACYALAGAPVNPAAAVISQKDIPHALWPWALQWFKPNDRRRDLEKAGALIIAEIERIDRAAATLETPHEK